MAEQWLVIVRGKQRGPFSSRQLRSLARHNQLGPGDLVSREGSLRWVPASKVRGLFGAPADKSADPQTPPASHPPEASLPAADGPLPLVVERSTAMRIQGVKRSWSPARVFAFAAGCAVVAIAGIAALVLMREPPSDRRASGQREMAALKPAAPAADRPVADASPAASPDVVQADPFAEPGHTPPAEPPVNEVAADDPAAGEPEAIDDFQDAVASAAEPELESDPEPEPEEAHASRTPIIANAAAMRHVQTFMKRHCHDCHGPDTQENGIRLDNLSTDLADPLVLATWQDALDQINKGEMPPQDEPRPADADVEKVATALGSILADAYARQQTSDRKAIVRRLNRSELRNTLRDLLHLDGPDLRGPAGPRLEDINGDGNLVNTSRGPVREFPADEEIHGFDTIGQNLVMSDFLLKLVLGAAEEALKMATFEGPKPSVEPRKFNGHLRRDGPGLEALARASNPDFELILQRYREPGAAAGILGRVAPHDIGHGGVGFSGRYRITIDVSAHNQKHPWGEMIRSHQDEPMLVGLHTADTRRGAYGDGNPTCRQLKQWEIPGDGTRHMLVHEAWFDDKWTPWVGWENAPFDGELLASRLIEKYYPDLFTPRPKDDAPEKERQDYEPAMVKKLFERGYLGPQLRIHGMTIELLLDAWPPQSHVALYGQSGSEPPESLILPFARRAYREPVTAAQIEPYVRFVESNITAGVPRPDALRAAYSAILASPRFLYVDGGEGRLSPHRLAERLAYFLWSSMPDEELSKLADSGGITDPEVLRGQVDRMLAHENAGEFVERFVDRWLRLDKLGKMPPEMSGPFRWYWDRQMESEMRLETYTYFADVLARNGPIRDFIDSDYSFMNERMATIVYDRRDVWGNGFRKVKLTDSRRGGVLTHASVLTATANGVDTSPVVRGVWVLESLLGTTPPPPPPNVQPLPPDLRGALTIREQLAKHRADTACAACHRKIDPLGFALENFNAVGVWRTNYPGEKNLPVDPSATMANGRQVPDITAFRRMLLEREDEVTRSLCEKLLTYGTGRLMEPGDRGEIDSLVARLKKRNGGLRDLIELVVLSPVFLEN